MYHSGGYVSVVVPRSRFLGDTGVPLPEFQGDIYKFWGTHQIFQILPVTPFCNFEESPSLRL